MALVNLNVYPRQTTGKNENRRTRATGRIPAVLYGEGRPAVNVALDAKEFAKITAHRHGGSVIFNLTIEGQADQPLALMREIQQHPVNDAVLHVDLFEVPRGEEVTVEVPVLLTGEPQCVKFAEGEVIQTLEEIELSCLPGEMPDSVLLDVADLVLHDRRYVRDLQAPVGRFVTPADTLVLVVKPVSLVVEEEAAPAEAEAEAAAPEGEAAAEPKAKEPKAKD
jgi:large subunit ribosomal protein L25